MNAAVDRSASDWRPGGALYGEVLEFLYREAELLDSNRYSDWLALFADDVLYEMPVRTDAVPVAGPGFQAMSFFDDNIHSLRTRVRGSNRYGLGRNAAFANAAFRQQSADRAGSSDGECLASIEFHDHANPRRAGLSALHRAPRGYAATPR
jgi:hypothetical protein